RGREMRPRQRITPGVAPPPSCPPCPGKEGGAQAPLPPSRSSRLVEPDLAEIVLEGLVHAMVLHGRHRVVVELAPVRLDDDPRILKDFLDVGHHDLALL